MLELLTSIGRWGFRNPLLVAALVLLAACKTDGSPPPAVEIHTVTKTVEVQRPCAVTKPTRPTKLARPLPTDAVALAALALAKLAEWAGPGGYGERADTAITTCTKEKP